MLGRLNWIETSLGLVEEHACLVFKILIDMCVCVCVCERERERERERENGIIQKMLKFWFFLKLIIIIIIIIIMSIIYCQLSLTCAL